MADAPRPGTGMSRATNKPKPFSRPSIAIGGSEPARTWLNIPAGAIREGDTVADFGTVERVESVAAQVRFTNLLGRKMVVSKRTEFLVYTHAS